MTPPSGSCSPTREVRRTGFERLIGYCIIAPFLIVGACLSLVGDFRGAIIFVSLPFVTLAVAWSLKARFGPKEGRVRQPEEKSDHAGPWRAVTCPCDLGNGAVWTKYLPMVSPKSSQSPPASLDHRAFSLVELLMVVAIIGIVLTFLVPAFTSIKTANDLTNATNGVAGTLERARTYAMANNLYVYVGIAEVNADVAVETVPQSPATDNGGGRLAVAVVAVRDGTRGYDLLSSLPDPAWTAYSSGAALIPLGKPEMYENVHLAKTLGPIPARGSMARPATSGTYSLGNAVCKSITPFSWPLGTALGSGQYNFEKVIQFDPQGVARIQYATNQDIIAGWMEVALQQTHGSMIPPEPATPTGAIAAIQVDGMTGAVRVYRP